MGNMSYMAKKISGFACFIEIIPYNMGSSKILLKQHSQSNGTAKFLNRRFKKIIFRSAHIYH